MPAIVKEARTRGRWCWHERTACRRGRPAARSAVASWRAAVDHLADGAHALHLRASAPRTRFTPQLGRGVAAAGRHHRVHGAAERRIEQRREPAAVHGAHRVVGAPGPACPGTRRGPCSTSTSRKSSVCAIGGYGSSPRSMACIIARPSMPATCSGRATPGPTPSALRSRCCGFCGQPGLEFGSVGVHCVLQKLQFNNSSYTHTCAAMASGRHAAPQGCTNLKLRQASRLVTRHYERFVAPTGLKITQYSLLSHVVKLGPLRAGATGRGDAAGRLDADAQPAAAAAAGPGCRCTPATTRAAGSSSATDAGRALRSEAQRAWKRAQLGPERAPGHRPRRGAARADRRMPAAAGTEPTKDAAHD